jgi:hypothetical protein
MPENNQAAQVDPHFLNLLLSLEASAMQSLGKIINPLTGKAEKNLVQAQFAIDMLDTLDKKTAGNLSPEEDKLIKRVLYQLRMNYVDEMQAGQKSDETRPEGGDQKPEPEASMADDKTAPSDNEEKAE